MGVDGVHLVLLFPFDEFTRLRNEIGAKFRGFGEWRRE